MVLLAKGFGAVREDANSSKMCITVSVAFLCVGFIKLEQTIKPLNQMKNLLLLLVLFSIASFTTTELTAQSSKYDEAVKDIESTFGHLPSFFDAFPEHALYGAWESFKALTGPETSIEPKNRELIQLAVASQIPCQYCVYFHTASAEAFGATKQEIEEAVALGANTRHWSMILQGAQIDYEEFKMEFGKMMDYMAKQAEK